MKSIVNILLILSVIGSFIFSGCELFTGNPGKSIKAASGDNLVISEIFTLPPDRYYAYSWIEIYNPSRQAFNWWTQTSPAIALVVGDNGAAIYTTDNGNSWQRVNTGTTDNLRATSFPLREFGYAVGDNGTYIKFVLDTLGVLHATDITDSISSYDPNSLNPGKKNINDITLGSGAETWGYMVGDSGLILRSSNRGEIWTKNTDLRISQNLRSVFNAYSARFAVGDSGTILKSTRNKVWEFKAPPEEFPKANFTSCAFAYDTGWVVGSGGSIAFTKSGGNIFTKQDSKTTETLRDIFFSPGAQRYDPQTAWIAGDGGIILKTKDMGVHWIQAEVAANVNMNKIYMADSSTGIAFGEGGTVLYTFDGGERWLQMPQPLTSETFWGAHFNPPNVIVDNKYILEIKAKRKEFFVDLTTGTVNYDVFVKIDTGYIVFDPASLASNGITIKAVPPGGFTIIDSDSIRFTNHTKLGPGSVTVINANIGYYFDTTAANSVKAVLWDLLSTGEIRLIKYSTTVDRYSNQFLQFDKRIIDVVRWGNFIAPDSMIYAKQLNQVWPQGKKGSIYDQMPYLGNEPRFDQNVSMGFIPEWYSMSRYANDVGNSDPNKLNSSTSFYMAQNPLPGWYSQKRK